MSQPDALRELDALGARYGLDAHQQCRLATLLDILRRDEHAPTAIRSPDRAVTGHIADSLVGLEHPAVRLGGRIVDIGAGAGFPGLALAVAMPAGELRLLESQSRKCAFLEEVVSRLDLDNAHVVCARAEEWTLGVSAHDLAVARAVASQPVLLEYAAPLLRLGGRLVDWRGRRDQAQEAAAMRAAMELGLRREEIRRVQPFAGARDHHLHVFVKVAETPARFPRRAGMARKRPLGGPATDVRSAPPHALDERPRESDQR
jgi:16S rRNA (guanine527-N7)-methyltransferase